MNRNYLRTFTFSFCLLLLGLSFLFQIDTTAQPNKQLTTVYRQVGLPLIRNFAPKEYGASAQNWSVIQDFNGVMYFANTLGVLEYDGESWRQLDIPKNIARSLNLDSEGNVLVGGSNQFGYLKRDSKGELSFVSLSDYLPDSLTEFGDIWSISTNDEGVLFQSTSNLFFYHFPVSEVNDSSLINIWQTETVFNPAFSVYDEIYIPEREVGLQKLAGDSLIIVLANDKISVNDIYIMLPYPSLQGSNNNLSNKVKPILFGVVSDGFYIWDSHNLKKLKTEADDYILENNLYLKGALLPDDTYAIPTQSGGLVIIDTEGKLIRIVNKKNGLNDNTVWYVFPDNAGGLWLGLNNGIARLNLPSPIAVIDQRLGLEGSVISMKRIDNTFFITTSNGVYYLDNSPQPDLNFKLKKYSEISVQTWDIYSDNRGLLFATSDGIFQSVNKSFNIIPVSWNLPYHLHKSELNKQIIYVGLHKGLARIVYEDGHWKDGGKIKGIEGIIVGIVEEDNGVLWLQSFNEGIYKLKPEDKFSVTTDFNITHYGKTKGASFKQAVLLEWNNKLLLGTDKGIKVYDDDSDSFVPAVFLGEDISDSTFFVKDIEVDSNNDLWILRGNGEDIELKKITSTNSGKFNVQDYPHINLIIDSDLNFTEASIKPDVAHNLVWISNNDKLYRYQFGNNFIPEINSAYLTLIRKITINTDSVIFYGNSSSDESSLLQEYSFPFNYNSITFEFSAANYIRSNSVKYRFKLDGFDEKWSSWSRDTRKEYTNLTAGNYKFIVQSKDIFNKLGKSAEFNFVVLPPWYKTVWAYLVYLLLFGLLLWFVVRTRVNYLERKTRKLESLVDERTEEVVKQKEQLEIQAEKLLEMDHIKSNFFANISHEFRTPLTLIMGQIENVLREVKNDNLVKKLRMAGNNSLKLQKLINQILDLSKLESGEMKLKYSHADIISFLKKRIAAFESFAARKKIDIQLLKDREQLWLYFDFEKMEDVFNNLLSNAFKFTNDEGKVTIKVSSDEKRNDDGTNTVKITIADNGVGIPKEKLKMIFERFYQVDGTDTKEQEGTGIGLSLVKELVELHKGKISVNSEVGKGSEFTVELPLGKYHIADDDIITKPSDRTETFNGFTTEQLDDLIVESKTEDVDEQSTGSGRELILLIEDNPDMRLYILENIQQNFRVIEAVNGEEGFNKAIELMPDLIITDVMMPKMNGYELSRKIKNERLTSHIPIIMLTAKAEEDSKLEGLEIGVDDYLIKPFSTKELLVRVENLIKLRRLLKEKYNEITAIDPKEIDAQPLDQEFLQKVFNIVKENIDDEQFGVPVIASEIGMSVSQLNRKLNALINQTAGKLIRSTRLEYAAKLLEQNAGNISEIAYRIGFADATSFTKSFKEKFGSSPSEYLRKIKDRD